MTGTFTFAVISDTHIRALCGDQSSPYAVNEKANGRARYAVQLVAGEQPDLIIHLGDMVHPLPHMTAYLPASEEAKKIFRPIASGLHFVPGNHDIGDKPSLVSPAGAPDETSLGRYGEAFGESHYAFKHQDVNFVVMNSSLVNTGSEAEQAQRQWLETTLRAAKGEKIYLFSHYPPFICSADEEDHYDNYAEPGRSWLLELVAETGVEAVFSGHVHHFFANTHKGVTFYCYPATSFTRQDYAALFDGPVAPEFGRDDGGKFGVTMVDVTAEGHNFRFLPTFGRSLEEGESLPDDALSAPRNLSFLTPHLRHDWAGITSMPYNGPMEEFSRKQARDDYPLLRVKQLGIGRVRTTLKDLETARRRARMDLWSDLGIRFVLSSIGLPDARAQKLLASHGRLVDSLDIAVPDFVSVNVDDVVDLASRHPLWISKITTSSSNQDPGRPFAHTVSCGALPVEIDAAAAFMNSMPGSASAKMVIQVPWGDDPAEVLSGWPLGLDRLVLNVRLAAGNPALPNFDQQAILKLLTDLSGICASHPLLEVALDTFQDFDRGYHPRLGLVDGRSNIHEWLFDAGGSGGSLRRHGTG